MGVRVCVCVERDEGELGSKQMRVVKRAIV